MATAEETSNPDFDTLGALLDTEFGDGETVTEETKDDTVTETQETEAPETQGDDTDAPDKPEDTEAEEPKPEDEKGDPSDDTSSEDEPKHDVQDDDQAPKSPKELVKEALAEARAEEQGITQARTELRNEIRQAYFPDGVSPEPILDSENKPIRGISDIAGKLLNPDTNEVFTWEEAKDWYDRKQTERNDWVNTIEQNIDALAEKNQSLIEGEKIVIAKHGALLKSLPEVAKETFDAFQSTLKKDPKTGIVLEAPVDVVAFYDMVLKPYAQVSRQMDAKAGAEAATQAEADKAKAELGQKERADLPPTADAGKGEKKDALDTAFDEYFNQ